MFFKKYVAFHLLECKILNVLPHNLHPVHFKGKEMVINVEYNQLDPLLRATGHADGDVNDESGYSPYPGNINQVSHVILTINISSKRNRSLILFTCS